MALPVGAKRLVLACISFIYVMLVRELLWLLVDEKTGECGDRRHLYARVDRVWAAFAVAP